jgi:hypothetical protein
MTHTQHSAQLQHSGITTAEMPVNSALALTFGHRGRHSAVSVGIQLLPLH